MHLGWFEGIVRREMDVQEKYTAGIRWIFWPHNRGLPVKHIVTDGASGAVGRRILPKIDQFLGSQSKEWVRCEMEWLEHRFNSVQEVIGTPNPREGVEAATTIPTTRQAEGYQYTLAPRCSTVTSTWIISQWSSTTRYSESTRIRFICNIGSKKSEETRNQLTMTTAKDAQGELERAATSAHTLLIRFKDMLMYYSIANYLNLEEQ